ncbi:MAG: alpha/beta hydrolase [Gammaproteobacteria bacterium PRO9]|nr:alpha/beta hydrolase [Gammaproteobacteria bacterium PRO9]
MIRSKLLIAILLLAPLVASAAPAVESRIVTGAGGVPLQVIETGPRNAPGILFVHGFALSSSSWKLQFESSLADDYHLVALDLRGHGNSGKPWKLEGYEDSQLWADDLAAVIKATGLERPVIVAWSYGGHVAMDFMRHYPVERVAGVVFVGSSGGMLPWPRLDPAIAAEFGRLAPLAVSADAGDRLEAARGFVKSMVHAPVKPALLEQEVAAMLAMPPFARAGIGARKLDNAALADRLTLPVLFLFGDHERTVGRNDAEALAARLPAARVLVYEDSGHMPFLEHPERFDTDLRAFVQSVTRAVEGGTSRP